MKKLANLSKRFKSIKYDLWGYSKMKEFFIESAIKAIKRGENRVYITFEPYHPINDSEIFHRDVNGYIIFKYPFRLNGSLVNKEVVMDVMKNWLMSEGLVVLDDVEHLKVEL
ncbi:hypothetical protein [Metaclostridioides mangenotii]|uniref:Uncharacterized protein n=1 Tax=Metaclostridioides mangenotii TaxID=1540 RepID=A0ABS4E8V9_9FIRM|nr:hypothetical protein [Clostridioides mangenotii]MBP1854361.1 hypothetical protein [Clostridioides mangenotii]